MPTLTSLALFTADPWESAMPVLRVSAPAAAAGVRVLRGNDGASLHLDTIQAADVLVIQRDFPRFSGFEDVLARATALGKPVVYEVDDQILEVPPGHVSHAAFEGVLLGMLRAALRANAVITSTPALQDYFRAFNPNTLLVRNALPDALWQVRAPVSTAADTLTIGYMGGATHRQDLETIAPALLSVLNRFGDGIRARFWGGEPPEALRRHPRVTWTPLDMLNYADFAAYFSQQQADIWLAPLAQTDFNRFKSPIKFLEYSALGAPGVYSRAEAYAGLVLDGDNGLLAGSPAEWEAALSRLVQDAALRLRLAQRAQETLRRGWLLSQRAPEWAAAYQAALDAPAPPPAALERVLAQASRWQSGLEARTQQAESRAASLQTGLNAQAAHLAGVEAQLGALTGSRSYRLLRSLQRGYDRLRGRA